VPARLVPLPALPIDKLLGGAADELADTLARVLATEQEESAALVKFGVAVPATLVPPIPPAADVALTALRELILNTQDGKPVAHLYPTISRLISHQDQRAEVVKQIILAHTFIRAVVVAQARSHLEHGLIVQAYRSELSPTERLALLELLLKVEDKIQARIDSGAVNISDLLGQIQKISALAIDEDALKAKFAKTTPQGREVVRKLAIRLGKAVREVGR
jgi:hypothetical protein